MDYEKAYKDALERARKMMDSKRSVVICKQALETIFPELRESEDSKNKHSNYMVSGVELIAEERERQINKEGFNWRHDDSHDCHQLSDAAIVYAAPAPLRYQVMNWWPWDKKWLKEDTSFTTAGRIKELTKAGALIAAEIDRLQRTIADASEQKESEDERIRKFFAELATDACGGPGQEYYEELGLNYDKVMGWLEKQKEPTEYVFRPLAGIDITIAAEQAIRRAMEGDHLVLAFNGVYLPVREYNSAKELVDEYYAHLEKQKEDKEELVYRMNGLMQEYIKEGKDEEEQEHRMKCYKLFWDALEDSEFFKKQKEQESEDEECTDFTIYHPIKNGKGEYECIPYSFYGSLTSFSEDKDLIDFLRTCFYTIEECNEWIERQKEQKLIEFKENDERRQEIKVTEIIESLIRIYGRTQGEWIGGYDMDTLIHWVRTAFDCLNKQNIQQEQKPVEWSEGNKQWLDAIIKDYEDSLSGDEDHDPAIQIKINLLKSLRPQPIQIKEAYKDGFQTARHVTALTFMNHIDENRPEGKMGLSNAECEDIDKAFKENDWAKILQYAKKYGKQN